QWRLMAAQHPPHGRGLQAEAVRDEHRTATGEMTHDPHPGLHARPRLARMRVGDAGTILQTRRAVFPEPPPPPPRGRAGDAHLRRDMRDGTPRLDALNHDQPAGRSQPGVSVGHEKPPCVRAAELDSSNSTPEASPTSTTIRVSTSSAPDARIPRPQTPPNAG